MPSHLSPSRSLAACTAVLALLLALLAAPPAAAEDETLLPIVFVHGGAGSAAQYHTQAMRFTSNGYPAELLSALEYDGGDVVGTLAGAPVGPLSEHIDAVLEEHGVEQVHLVGHSLGTGVSGRYMDLPTRAAKVATYTGLDGLSVGVCPPGVRCLGVFAGSTGTIVGSERDLHLPDQGHVEVATSAESFAAQYELMPGEPPRTTLVVPEPPDEVVIAGRAVEFPQNVGASGATLNVYEVDPATGQRRSEAPRHTQVIGDDGAWGPWALHGERHHEFEVVRDGLATAHTYLQPFLRSSDFVRLLVSRDGSEIVENTNAGDGHAAAVVVREREWYAQREPRDQLWIGTRSDAGDVEPIDTLEKLDDDESIAMHVHDAEASPGESTGEELPYFPSQPFQMGVDVFMPAASPPDGTISFVNVPRGDAADEQAINVPNWPSSTHRISVRFNDYVQDLTSFEQCLRLEPSPCDTALGGPSEGVDDPGEVSDVPEPDGAGDEAAADGSDDAADAATDAGDDVAAEAPTRAPLPVTGGAIPLLALSMLAGAALLRRRPDHPSSPG